MRIIKVLVALPMILLFGTLRFAVNIISKIYCRAASLVFVPMIILLILSVIETQWLAVGIVGAAISFCFILLFAIGQEFSKGLMHGYLENYLWITCRLPTNYLSVTHRFPFQAIFDVLYLQWAKQTGTNPDYRAHFFCKRIPAILSISLIIYLRTRRILVLRPLQQK